MRTLIMLSAAVLWLAACGDSTDSPATTTPAVTPIATPATTPPATTQAPVTAAVSDEQLAAAAAIGDAAAGELLFHEKLDGVPHSVSCSTCHVLDGENSKWAPTLAGVSARAPDRVDGLSAVEYLTQSVTDPSAFHVPGEWAGVMPYQYSDVLSEEQINNLVAFLLTR